MGEYHTVLLQEIQQYVEHEPRAPLKTVFFGGGTPSTYPPELLAQTLGLLKEKRGFESSYELTIEVNPGTVNEEKLRAWKELGINRLSIGVQSLNDEVLKRLNRHQKASDVLALLEAAAPLFDNISVDLIVGLPGVTSVEWKEMIATLISWPIKHVSMYFLTVHEDTQLYFGIQRKAIVLPSDDEVVDLYYWTIEQFALAGLRQYEISNFARPGWESQHNSMYWHRIPYKGFGLGACSFDGKVRSQNEKNLLNYMQGIKNNKNITVFAEQLSDKQVWLERLMLGLRQRAGIMLDEVITDLSEKAKKEFALKTEQLIEAKLITNNDGRIALTPQGLSVANEIIVQLSCVDLV